MTHVECYILYYSCNHIDQHFSFTCHSVMVQSNTKDTSHYYRTRKHFHNNWYVWFKNLRGFPRCIRFRVSVCLHGAFLIFSCMIRSYDRENCLHNNTHSFHNIIDVLPKLSEDHNNGGNTSGNIPYG